MAIEADANNGGYLQFLENWGRETYVYASQALKKIGARKMAEIIDECQALVEEHPGSEGPVQLLPNPVIDSDGTLLREPGSVLPDAVLARINDLSYEFMNYPENIGELGLKHYGSYLAEIERAVDERQKASQAKRAATFAALEADLRDAQRVQQQKLEQGKACPKCGFSYSWDGAKCGHCRYGGVESPR